MFNTLGKALVGVSAETGQMHVLTAGEDAGVIQTAMDQWRAFFTGVAASPVIDDETYERVMATIRSLRIIDVRISQVEAV